MKASLPAVSLLVALLAGCQTQTATPPSGGMAAQGPAPVLISVVSDMESNPQAVDMALKLAGFSLDEGREVFVFFNVKGVRVPLEALSAEVKFQENAPIREQLEKLIERGATAHVCPICMQAYSIEEGDLLKGAEVTNRAALFGRITPNTVVFTY